jgi:hypothetical protein
MAISLTTEKLKRYKDIALFLMKHSKKDLIRQAVRRRFFLKKIKKKRKMKIRS